MLTYNQINTSHLPSVTHFHRENEIKALKVMGRWPLAKCRSQTQKEIINSSWSRFAAASHKRDRDRPCRGHTASAPLQLRALHAPFVTQPSLAFRAPPCSCWWRFQKRDRFTCSGVQGVCPLDNTRDAVPSKQLYVCSQPTG